MAPPDVVGSLGGSLLRISHFRHLPAPQFATQALFLNFLFIVLGTQGVLVCAIKGKVFLFEARGLGFTGKGCYRFLFLENVFFGVDLVADRLFVGVFNQLIDQQPTKDFCLAKLAPTPTLLTPRLPLGIPPHSIHFLAIISLVGKAVDCGNFCSWG